MIDSYSFLIHLSSTQFLHSQVVAINLTLSIFRCYRGAMKENFAENLKSIRRYLGHSQLTLAKKSGLPPAVISHFEANRRKPSFESLIKLSDCLAVTLDRLVFGTVKCRNEK